MTEELLNALRVIKAECESQEECSSCPMSDKHGECGVVNNTPEFWRLEKREVYF